MLFEPKETCKRKLWVSSLVSNIIWKQIAKVWSSLTNFRHRVKSQPSDVTCNKTINTIIHRASTMKFRPPHLLLPKSYFSFLILAEYLPWEWCKIRPLCLGYDVKLVPCCPGHDVKLQPYSTLQACVDEAVSGGKPPAGKSVVDLLSWHGTHFWVYIAYCKLRQVECYQTRLLFLLNPSNNWPL